MGTHTETSGFSWTTMVTLTAVGALGVFLSTPDLSAQSRTSTSLEDGRPAGSRLVAGTWTYRMQRIRDGRSRNVGTYVLSVERASRGGPGDAWLVVQRTDVQGGSATIVDSVWLESKSLRPLRQVSHSPRGDLALEFDRRGVRGERTEPNGETRAIEETFEADRYSASVIGPLTQSLSLEEGFRTSLPLFDDVQGQVPGEIGVTGSDIVELTDGSTVETLVLEVTVGVRSATRWVHPETGVEVRTRSELPSGGHFQQTLVEHGPEAAGW